MGYQIAFQRFWPTHKQMLHDFPICVQFLFKRGFLSKNSFVNQNVLWTKILKKIDDFLCATVFGRLLNSPQTCVPRKGAPRGHSTTTWTKFSPILTPSPLEWTNMDIFILSFVMWLPVNFLLSPSPPLLVHVVIEWPPSWFLMVYKW